jgi:hypothetical protein
VVARDYAICSSLRLGRQIGASAISLSPFPTPPAHAPTDSTTSAEKVMQHVGGFLSQQAAGNGDSMVVTHV